MCCKKYFYDKFIEIINQWKEDEIAAISILVIQMKTMYIRELKISLKYQLDIFRKMINMTVMTLKD